MEHNEETKTADEIIRPLTEKQKKVAKNLRKHFGKVGRPTPYRPEFPQRVHDYIATCVDEEDKKVISVGNKYTAYTYVTLVRLPTLEGFANFLGLVTKRLSDWRNQYPKFNEACDLIDQIQKERLVSGGLGGRYKENMTQFMLSANHNMRKKMDVTTDDKPVNGPITTGDEEVVRDDVINLAKEFDAQYERLIRRKVEGSKRQPAHRATGRRERLANQNRSRNKKASRTGKSAVSR